MAKLLVWFPAGGLGIMLLLLLYALVCGRRIPGTVAGNSSGLVLVLEDCEEQVEMLVRWLLFRNRWLESQVELTIALPEPAGDTLAILDRLHKERSFQIVTGNCLLETCRHQDVIRLKGTNPIPWDQLAGKLQGRQELSS